MAVVVAVVLLSPHGYRGRHRRAATAAMILTQLSRRHCVSHTGHNWRPIATVAVAVLHGCCRCVLSPPQLLLSLPHSCHCHVLSLQLLSLHLVPPWLSSLHVHDVITATAATVLT